MCLKILFCIFAISFAVFVTCDETENQGKLKIFPAQLKGDNYVATSGKAMRLICLYEDDDMDDIKQLQWENEDGKKIDESSSPNLFTIKLHERGTNFKKRSLVFTKINSRDSGTYTCVANVNGEIHRKSIHLHVIPNLEWNEPRDVVGAMIGEPLTIDCGANGKPQPDIEMTNEDGELLDENEYKVVDNEVSIDSLTKHYQNAKIRCLALQMLPEYDTTTVDKHEISIDVWFHPEFEKDEINKFALLGRPAYLFCNVTASNPRVVHFAFSKDNTEITDDDEDYEIIPNFDNQSAVLKINEVNEEDLGTYRCEVNNGKAKSHQLINLHVANPPNQVKASLERAHKHSIIWRLTTDVDEDDSLPIVSYKIEYVRSRLLDDFDSSEEEEFLHEVKRQEEQVWNSHGSHVIRAKTPNNLYEITGLVQDAEYVFRFTALNEAGSGDPIEIKAKTHSGRHHHNSANRLNFVFIFIIIFSLLLC